MSDYPTLEEIGVHSTDDVVKYSLSREAHLDVLKIHYKRKEGSLLAKSKKFHFQRGKITAQPLEKTTAIKTQHVAPQLLLAIEELRQLLADRPEQKRSETKQQISASLENLEKVIDSKLQHLQQQLNELGK